MAAFAKSPYVSPEEYLEWECNAEFRSPEETAEDITQ